MSLDVLEYQTGPKPTASIIVLHGLGADASDFVSLVQELKLASVGPVRYLFPNAPKIPVTINNGYVMPAWYDLMGTEFMRREDEAGLRRSQGQIDTLIARECSRGVKSSRIVLGGFSQGCAMTLMTGLRHPGRLGGLIGLSGYLPLAALTEAERHSANQGIPIFLAHGRQDPVIPIDRGIASRDALLALGHPVEWHEYPMPHTVSAQEVADLNRWLVGVLG
jgi:phospholipase/carboxylesterase